MEAVRLLTEQHIEVSLNIIKQAFKTHKRLALAFSGGKDSTTLLMLALEVLKEFKDCTLVVIHGDTLVENPAVRSHCDFFLESLRAYAERENLPVEIHIALPEKTNTYWVNLIGKGYPLPNHRFRWCQKHLKIEPFQKLQKSLSTSAVLVGIRKDESISRKNSIRKNYQDYERKEKGNHTIAPLLDWTEEQVWEFLTTYECEWTDLRKVYELYREASGECPVFSEVNNKACGTRFGCWVCTLATDLKELKNQGEKDIKAQMLYEFRNWLLDFCNRPENRTGRMRNGKFIGEGKGQLTLKAREEILKKLLELQEKIGMELIRGYELDIIEKEWKKEKR